MFFNSGAGLIADMIELDLGGALCLRAPISNVNEEINKKSHRVPLPLYVQAVYVTEFTTRCTPTRRTQYAFTLPRVYITASASLAVDIYRAK